MYELIIIGAGPAGMTAAVYAARKKLNALLLSHDVGGQVLWTSGIENYMGYQFIEGSELVQKIQEQGSHLLRYLRWPSLCRRKCCGHRWRQLSPGGCRGYGQNSRTCLPGIADSSRSEERRVGKECRSR